MQATLSQGIQANNFQHVDGTALIVGLVAVIDGDSLRYSVRWRAFRGMVDLFDIVKISNVFRELLDLTILLQEKSAQRRHLC